MTTIAIVRRNQLCAGDVITIGRDAFRRDVIVVDAPAYAHTGGPIYCKELSADGNGPRGNRFVLGAGDTFPLTGTRRLV